MLITNIFLKKNCYFCYKKCQHASVCQNPQKYEKFSKFFGEKIPSRRTLHTFLTTFKKFPYGVVKNFFFSCFQTLIYFQDFEGIFSKFLDLTFKIKKNKFF
jgi:hypothetical protein